MSTLEAKIKNLKYDDDTALLAGNEKELSEQVKETKSENYLE